MRRIIPVSIVLLALALWVSQLRAQPNILLIVTDDQGYSDVGYNGNPHLKTPTIDGLAKESFVFDQFYAQPVCSPTRAALMTGRHALRSGVIDTQGGVSILPPSEVTLAEAFKSADYRTGYFGKWHLGDNAPARPQDQGFDDVLTHIGGMIGAPYSLLDHQSYFDPLLIENSVDKVFDGFAPDIFTDGLIRFLSQDNEKPFLAVLSFNTPHHPLTVSDEFARPYRNAGFSEETARYYGMISNIDANIGRVLSHLEENDKRDETIIVFVGDNGTSSLHKQSDLWEAGLRGRKTYVYENGIRVPMLLHVPGMDGETRKIDSPWIVEDIMPTLLSLAGIDSSVDFDGLGFDRLLEHADAAIPERTLYFQFHRGAEPVPFRNIAVRRGNFKLVQPVGRGRESFSDSEARFELYDIKADPKETVNLIERLPETAETLKQAYRDWLRNTWRGQFTPVATWIGDRTQNPVLLTRQDWLGAGLFDGDQGSYALDVRRPGTYRLSLRWSELVDETVDATIEIGGQTFKRQLLRSESEILLEEVFLEKGPTRLDAWLDIGGQKAGFRFIEIEAQTP